jgi:hypothetical protein
MMIRLIVTALFLLVFVAAPRTAGAQILPEFRPREPIPEAARGFIGTWVRFPPGADNPQRGNCGKLVDQNGEPRRGCALPVDQLPLNERALAWVEFADELLAPVYECAAHTVPTLLGDVRPFRIAVEMDSILVNYEMGNTFRRIWMDGRGHPPPYQLFYQGHAIGRWEGNQLLVETTNFTFDPDGMDDHAHLPTSVRKRVVERYTLVNPDEMRIEITLEDPLFLSRPFTWGHTWRRAPATRQFDGYAECDPGVTRREIELTVKEKYPASEGN